MLERVDVRVGHILHPCKRPDPVRPDETRELAGQVVGHHVSDEVAFREQARAEDHAGDDRDDRGAAIGGRLGDRERIGLGPLIVVRAKGSGSSARGLGQE